MAEKKELFGNPRNKRIGDMSKRFTELLNKDLLRSPGKEYWEKLLKLDNKIKCIVTDKAKDLIKGAGNEWQEMNKERARYDKTQKVLRAYYGEDKVRDFILYLHDFLDSIRDPYDQLDIDRTLARGYDSYIAYLKQTCEKLMAVYDEPEPEYSSDTERKITSYLELEFEDSDWLKVIRNMERALELKKKYKRRKSVEDKADRAEIDRLLERVDSYNCSTEVFDSIVKQYQEKVAIYKKEREKAELICADIKKLLESGILDTFAPANFAGHYTLTADGIIGAYSSLSAKLDKITEKYII